jgi:hypothetical protein
MPPLMKNLFYIVVSIVLVITGLQCDKASSDSFAVTTTTGQGGSLARFTIVGNYLYTVDQQKLKVFSLVNPASPSLLSSTDVGFEIETIFPFKDKLFIGSTSVIHIFSITDPEHPQKLSTAISPNVMRRCDPVVAKDTVAYATLRTNGPCGGTQSLLSVFDIHDEMNPVQKYTVQVGEPYGLGYSDSVLYVCDRNGLNIYNIHNAYMPGFIKTIQGDWYMDVIPYGNTLICWVSDGLILYDITDKTNPVLITKIS